MQMDEHSGTDGLFWYFRFNGNLCPLDFVLIYDEIIKNDFDFCVLIFLKQKYVHLY
jgi:hypothetical protein